MSQLDPADLFRRIASDVPKELHQYLFVTGSLAAAYHFATALQGRGINTKDADLVVHPAGNAKSCQEMTKNLLAIGWKKRTDCVPQDMPEPAAQLRAIRLFPPSSSDYFVEFLNIPDNRQTESKVWIPVELEDGWYGLPSFRFLGLTSLYRNQSTEGLDYARPAMMALANLLSHREIGKDRIESDGPMQGLLRSAKDLGRVLALANLAGRKDTETWPGLWASALKECFPSEWQELALRAGSGLREMIENQAVMAEAQKTTDIGLLNGMNVTADMLVMVAERLFVDALTPLSKSAMP